ncbi:hypothetical protein RC52_22140 [Herbaspirillum rubrisubalbicans]|nr:hypothetical protein [Herbaspirillum rubrisubalbicans]
MHHSLFITTPKFRDKYIVHIPGLSSIVLIFKVMIDILTAADGFNLAGNRINKVDTYADIEAFQDASDDKIFAVCADDPVITTF